MTNYEKARLNKKKAEAESLAAFMEEFVSDPPYVKDENGHWLTKQELLEHVRNSWKDN